MNMENGFNIILFLAGPRMKLVGIGGTQRRPRLLLVEAFSAQVALTRDGMAWLGAIGCKWKELIR